MKIAERMHALVPALSGEQCEQFQLYYEMLSDWNTRINLTAITDPEEIAQKHFLDSLAAICAVSSNNVSSKEPASAMAIGYTLRIP